MVYKAILMKMSAFQYDCDQDRIDQSVKTVCLILYFDKL